MAAAAAACTGTRTDVEARGRSARRRADRWSLERAARPALPLIAMMAGQVPSGLRLFALLLAALCDGGAGERSRPPVPSLESVESLTLHPPARPSLVARSRRARPSPLRGTRTWRFCSHPHFIRKPAARAMLTRSRGVLRPGGRWRRRRSATGAGQLRGGRQRPGADHAHVHHGLRLDDRRRERGLRGCARRSGVHSSGRRVRV